MVPEPCTPWWSSGWLVVAREARRGVQKVYAPPGEGEEWAKVWPVWGALGLWLAALMSHHWGLLDQEVFVVGAMGWCWPPMRQEEGPSAGGTPGGAGTGSLILSLPLVGGLPLAERQDGGALFLW